MAQSKVIGTIHLVVFNLLRVLQTDHHHGSMKSIELLYNGTSVYSALLGVPC